MILLLSVIFQDITLSTEAASESFKTTLSYERHVWILEGTAKDESRHPHAKYSSLVRLSSPTSMVDVRLTSDAAADAETTSGGLGIQYLTSRDRQLKTLALKAEINRLRNELKLEVKLPRVMPFDFGVTSTLLGHWETQLSQAGLAQ